MYTVTEWQNLYFNKKLEEQQKKLNEAEQQKASQAAAIASLTEQVHQRDLAIQQIHGSLMFRMMLKLRAIATRLGMRHVLNVLRRIKHGHIHKPAELPVPVASKTPAQRGFDYNHMLSLTEYRFLAYKESRLEHYAALLSEMESPYVRDMVSVILPVYNGDDLLALSIESVLNQTYQNFEFIIVDDGSFDNTPAIVDDYAAKDSRIRIVHQKNQKLPRTLSNGFALAHGEFLTWTSADNIMHPNFLEKLVGEMKAHPQTGMVYANLDLIDEKGAPLTDFEWYADPTAPEVVRLPQCVLELNTYADNYVAAAFMYRASVAHAIGGYSANRYTTEDYDYWMRINECFNLRHTSFDDPIYDYRFHSKSLTSQDKELKISANRYRLMLWDDFRRAFLLRPLTWSFSGFKHTDKLHGDLADILKLAGHTVITSDEERALLCQSDYTATVHVAFDGESADPNQLPVNCYKICVCENPRQVSSNWDCLISVNGVTVNDFIEGHKGWFTFASAQAMFVFLDTRAKSEFLSRMETTVETRPEKEKELSVILTYQGNLNRLRFALLALAEQKLDQRRYEVLVVAPQSCRSEVGDIFDSIWQKKHLDVSLLRFVASETLSQGNGANVGLWAARGRYVAFADADAVCPEDYAQNILLTFQLYPKAVAVCGELYVDQQHEMPELADFQVLADMESYDANGCVAFDVYELMLVGGFTVADDVPGVCVPSGWELTTMGRLFQHGRTIVRTNAVRQILQSEPIPCQEVITARLKNEFNLQVEGLTPFSMWLEEVTACSTQAQARVQEACRKGQDALHDIYLSHAYRVLYDTVLKYFKSRGEVETARERYTRHWADADGTMRGINPLTWLEEQMQGVLEPWVSIIVPVYKVEQYLERCVDSLRNQTLCHIEILLVDDGSPDSCPALCDQYAREDKRIRVIHKKNGGLSDARNAGIDEARGEYFAFVDSDDWVEPDMFEQLLYAVQLCDAQIAECSFDNVYENRTEAETANNGRWVIGDRVFALKCEIEWSFFKSIACAKIYHKSIFADGKRYPVGKYHEDEFFTHRAFYDAQRLVFIDRCLYHYDHTRDDSITGKSFNEKGLDVVEAMRQRCTFFKEKNEIELYHRMLDLYAWTALDRLEKCTLNGIAGSKVELVKSWLRADRLEMKAAGVSLQRLGDMDKVLGR